MSSNKGNNNSRKGNNKQKTTNSRNFASKTQECSNGDNCKFFKQGRCTFLHTCPNNETCRNTASNCPYDHPEIRVCHNRNGNEHSHTYSNSNTTPVVNETEKKVECSKGDDCKFFKQGRCTFLHTCPNNRTCRNTESNCKYDHPPIKMCHFGYECHGRRSGNCPFEHPEEPTANDDSRDETEPEKKVTLSRENLPSAPGEFISETPVREFKSTEQIKEEKKAAKLLAKENIEATKLAKKKEIRRNREEIKRILDFQESTKIFEFKEVEDEGDNQITEIPATQRKTTQVVIPKQQIQRKEVEIPRELKKYFGTKVTLDKLPKVQRVSRGYYLVKKSSKIYVSLDKYTWYNYITPILKM